MGLLGCSFTEDGFSSEVGLMGDGMCFNCELLSLCNGEQKASFVPTRGLRQGDPLSPYLFILVADVLSNLLSKSLRGRQISGFKIARHCPTLSHLLFADDVLLFLKADISECQKVLDLLSTYCVALGQLINFDKSSVRFSSNVSPSLCSSICTLSGLQVSLPNAKYLGLPLFWERSKAEAYEFLIEKVVSKLQGWKMKLLSQAARETLIKAVVQVIPSYAMACFAFPKNFCAKLNSYIRGFWWGRDMDGKGIHWVGWEKLVLSKFQGRLGFRDFNMFNLALLARQW
ncbi:hypothetical protein CsSME_00035555 [Camellia sinensis var. sinensis]